MHATTTHYCTDRPRVGLSTTRSFDIDVAPGRPHRARSVLLGFFGVLLALLATITSAWAADTADVKKRFQEHFKAVPVDNVTLTPYGLYEVQVGDTLLYTNADVNWVMEGILIDTATRQNVTAARQEQLNAIAFDQLPLTLAFEQVKGNGSRKIAIFEDPNCPYCKQLRRTLESVDNLTIYTFLYPILSPDSRVKSESVWCASDKGSTWDAWMLGDTIPPAAQCGAPLDEFVAAGQQLRVRGTPTVFFEDGTRASGALPAAIIEQRLARAAR